MTRMRFPPMPAGRACGAAIAWLLLGCLGLAAHAARAEPYLAVRTGYKCAVCHVNPTGGGLRSNFGDTYAEVTLPASPLAGDSSLWTGQLVQNILRMGADLRTDWSQTTTPHAATARGFDPEQLRLYAEVSVVPDRLELYVDEALAPGAQNMEAYVRYGSAAGWYLKVGQFYLPFGWRLQDNTAFVRQATGINMTAPDRGVELGYERSRWDAQLDFTNGAGSTQSGSDYQVLGQIQRVQDAWRIGAAAAATRSDAGDRRMAGLFAGLRTGPLVWLGEADVIRQQGFTDGAHTSVAGLAEVNWAIARGHNLKLTDEFYDPQRGVPNNQQIRWSVVYEFTPLPFMQLRAGFRRYQGIPQNALQNRTITFIELHGFM